MNLKSILFPSNPFSIFVILTVFPVIAYWMWSFDVNIAKENGLLESGQYIFLVLACLLNVYHYKNSARMLEKFLHGGLSLFCFAIVLREFDIDKIGLSPLWDTIETFIRGLTLIAFLIYVACALKNSRLLLENLSDILNSSLVILTLSGCIFYICGWPFDKLIFIAISADLSVFIEEVLELNATLLFFFASYAKENHQTTTTGVLAEQ